jgi:ubiquinone/menaquinone biosynthesis C-methylase UbiE
MMDWRTYDDVPEAYERRWEVPFVEAARRLLARAFALAPPHGADKILDLGTGTGAVLAALGARRKTMSRVVGCDRSLPMLESARRYAPRSAVAADITRLPFRSGSFDLVTANCVLSHVHEHTRALDEVRRVLVAGGVFASASWGPASDPYGATWTKLLGGAVTKDAVARALEEVGPREAFFSSVSNLREALCEAGFRRVEVDVGDLPFAGSVSDYLAEREIGTAGRFGRHVLGESGWRLFLTRAEGEFQRRFGDKVSFARPLLLGVGQAP